MHINWNVAFWFAVIIVAEMVSFWFVKKAAVERKILYLIIAMAVYTLTIFGFYKILQNGNNLGIVNLLWNLFSTLYGFLMGILIFNEKITTLELVGSMFGLLSLFFILSKDVM